MPQVDDLTLVLLDAALKIVGVAVLTQVIRGWARDNFRRNPLDSCDFTRAGPGIFAVGTVFILYVLLATAFIQFFGVKTAGNLNPGSHGWHQAQVLDALAGLIVAVVMVFMLRQAGNFPAPSEKRGLWHPIQLSLGTVVVIFPIVDVQLNAIHTTCFWYAPDWSPPVHVVLQAIENSVLGGWGAAQLAVSAIVIAPLVEELFFRGMLLGMLTTQLGRVWPAVLLSGAVFGAIHFQQPQAILPLASMGVILGYVRVRYRSLTVCVLAHALFNARTIIIVVCNPDFARSTW